MNQTRFVYLLAIAAGIVVYALAVRDWVAPTMAKLIPPAKED